MTIRDEILRQAHEAIREELSPLTEARLIEDSRRWVAQHQSLDHIQSLLRVFGVWHELTRTTLGIPDVSPAPPVAAPVAAPPPAPPAAPEPPPRPARVSRPPRPRLVSIGQPTNDEPPPPPLPEFDDELTAALSSPDF